MRTAISSFIVTLELRVKWTAFAILAMFEYKFPIMMLKLKIMRRIKIQEQGESLFFHRKLFAKRDGG